MTWTRGLFVAAAIVPCVAVLLFGSIAIHETWLIGTHQIAVIATPVPGQKLAPEVPARNLLPLIFGSAALAALFGYAALRNSKKALGLGYLVLLLLAVVPYAVRQLS